MTTQLRSTPSFPKLAILAPAILTLGMVVLWPSTAKASENYQLFRLDLGGLIAFAHGPGSWGPGAYVEPKFHVLDQLTVGASISGAAMFGGSYNLEDAADVSVDVRAAAAFLAKVDYFPFSSWFRPFIGFGIGGYRLAGQSVSVSSTSASIDQSAGMHFGIAPQIGFNIGSFRLALSYNAIFGAATRVTQSVAVGEPARTSKISQNYLSIEIGGTLWGKKKDKPKEKASKTQGSTATR